MLPHTLLMEHPFGLGAIPFRKIQSLGFLFFKGGPFCLLELG